MLRINSVFLEKVLTIGLIFFSKRNMNSTIVWLSHHHRLYVQYVQTILCYPFWSPSGTFQSQ